MKFSRKTAAVSAAVLVAAASLLMMFRTGSDTGRPGRGGLRPPGYPAANAVREHSAEQGAAGGGNRLLEFFGRLTSLERSAPAADDDPETLHRRLMDRVSSEEKIPRAALTPSGYSAEAREKHYRLLSEIADLGERARKGTATPAERKRRRELLIGLLEDKIRQIRDSLDTMQDYGDRTGREQNGDIERGVQTMERLQAIVDSLKKE